MSSINPSSGSTAPLAPTTSTPTAPVPATSVTSLDTISATTVSKPTFFQAAGSSRPGLEAPQPLSLLQYSNLVGIARINLQSQSNYSSELGFNVNKHMWDNTFASAALVRQMYNDIVNIQQNQTLISQQEQAQVNAVTPSINAYNASNDFSGDQAATDAVNQAITDYNNGVITQAQYNDAVNTYNTYAQNHNMQTYATDYDAQATAYNSQVDAINTDITALNVDRAQQGLIPFPLETMLPSGLLPSAGLSPPAVTPIPLIPNPPSTIPNVTVGVPTVPLNTVLQNANFKSRANNLLDGANTFSQILGNAEKYRNSTVFIHKDLFNIKNPSTERSSYVQDNNQGSKPSPTGNAAASSSGYTSLALGLSSSGITRVLGLNVFTAAAKQSQIPAYLSDFLTLINIAIGQKAGLLSAAPGVLAVGDSSLGNLAGGPPTNILVALGFSSVIRGLIASNQLSGLVGNLLASNGVSENDLVVLTRTITAGLHLSLIQQAILQVANALGLPGSISQVLGNVSGIPNLDSILGSAVNPTVNDVLRNTRFTDSLKKALTQELILKNTEMDAQQASLIVNQAVDNANAEADYASTYAYSQALKDELIQQGVDEQSAQESASQTNALVSSEISSAYLDDEINQSQIDESIQNSDLIKQDTQKSELTARSIRDATLMSLSQQGYAFQDALKKSDELAAILTGNRLAQEFSAQTLKEGLLQKSLAENIARYGGDPGMASSIAASILSSSYRSAQEVRDSIYAQMIASGMNIASAHGVADNASLVSGNINGFGNIGGSGSVLSPSEVADKLASQAYELLKGSFDNPTARSIAEQLAAAVVGSPTNQDIEYSNRINPTSLLNQANDQIAILKETNENQILNAVRESFRETMRPTDDLSYIVNKQNEPGTELINAMSLMNAGHGKHPTNFVQSVDIPA